MEYLPDFKLHRPTDVDEAVKLRAGADNSRYLAGGTDMVVNVRRGIEQPAALIDVTEIGALRDIREDDDGIHIGAAVPLHALAEHEGVRRGFAAVAEAAESVAGPTHRQYGTVGGNLCLDTRCLYYNQSEWWRESNAYCLKERGEICHVAPKGTFCFAAFSGDVAPAMLVHGAEVDLVGPDGARRVSLADLYNNDGMDHLALKPAELLTTAHLPKAQTGLASKYAKSRIRGSIDFPLAGVAVGVRHTNGVVEELRVGLTAVAPWPFLIEGMDDYAGKPLDEEALDQLREGVRHQAKPMRTTTVAPWYRRRVVGNLARRLAAELAAG